jgi:EmrB/QacA subfamily drug resistance transporter
MSASSIGIPPALPAEDELPRRTIIATMAGVIATMLMAALDGTIVGTAMPRVISELHGFEHYAAVTTIYLLASTTIVPIAGKLSDLYGRKLFLLIGVSLFVLGSALCGGATSMMQLIIFRGLQGLGAGFSQAMAFTAIADLFPPSRRGKISGLMGAVFGLASVIGPAVGGFLTDGPGWRWCFWVNIPIGIIAFIILYTSFPKTVLSGQKRSIDYFGALTLVLSVVPLLLALSWGGRDYAWSSSLIIGLLVLGGIMMGLFFFTETRVQEPIIPLGLFKNRVVWTSMLGASLVSVAMLGTTLFIPLFIQAVIGTSATKSGAVLTPMMFTMIASSMISGQLMSRRGRYKSIAVFGVSMTTVALFLLSQMDVSTQYITVLRNMMIMGVGLGATMPVFSLAVQNAVDPSQVGVGTSSVQFVRSMGGSIGAAVFGSILSNSFSPAFHQALPSNIAAVVPPELLARFDNPQMLLNPNAMSQMPQSGPMASMMAPLLQAVKEALASSLQHVFFIACCLTGFAVLSTLLLKDVPLRTTNRVAPPVEH